MISAIATLAGVAMCIIVLNWITQTALKARDLDRRLREMREQIERDRKQAEIVAEQRTPDDAIDRLDRGNF